MRYLTPAHVAQMLAVSVKTVSRWALTDPTFPATRLGRTVRIEEQALQRWLGRKTGRKLAQVPENMAHASDVQSSAGARGAADAA